MVLGRSVIRELKMAYWTAVNDTLVSWERKATKAALARPAVKLSAEITAYKMRISWPA